MHNNWKKYKLGDLCSEISYGYTESASWDNIGPKFLRITDIQNDSISWSQVPHCKISDKDKLKYSLEIGDIVIARTGNSTGATAIIKEKIEAVYASYLIKYKINRSLSYPFFIGHILKSSVWWSYVASIRGGSAQPGANAKQFADFEISLPTLPEQKAIAEILSSLDDKIELNLQTNKTLEEMASALYKHWFVDFGPFKDGKFVESELGLIPKGWTVNTIKNAAHIITKGTTPTTLKKQFVEKGINFIKAESLDENGNFIASKFAHIDEETDHLLKRSRIQKNDVLITIAGTIGRIAIVPNHILPANTNQAIGIIRPDENTITPLYLMLSLKNETIRAELFSHIVESVQANLSLGTIGEAKIVLPDLKNERIISTLSSIDDLYSLIESNTIDIQNLKQTRDYILPKLISGEIRVKEAEKRIKELV